jgi:hypothetical protein
MKKEEKIQMFQEIELLLENKWYLLEAIKEVSKTYRVSIHQLAIWFCDYTSLGIVNNS